MTKLSEAEENLRNEDLLLYFACLEEEKNLAQASRDLFPEKSESARTAISRKDSDTVLHERGLGERHQNGRYKFKSEEKKIGAVIAYLLQVKDGKLPPIEDAEGQVDELQEMFTGEGARFLKVEYIRRILGETVSDTTKSLSVYFKSLVVILGGSKVVLSRLETNHTSRTIGSEQLQRINNFLNFFFAMNPNQWNEFRHLMEILTQEVPQMDLKALPDSLGELDLVREMSDAVENMIHKLVDEEKDMKKPIDFFKETPDPRQEKLGSAIEG